MSEKALFAVGFAMFGVVSSAFGGVASHTRDSAISANMITVGPEVSPVASTAVDSSADLSIDGMASYTDGFGRDFRGDYTSTQDVTFASSGFGADLVQSVNTQLVSEGFPGSTVFSIEIFNEYLSSFTVSEETTLRLTLNFTGTVTTGSAADRIDFRINTQFGGLYVLPTAVPAGQYVDETIELDFTFSSGTTYFIVAEGRAFAGGATESVASRLSFAFAPVPTPSAGMALAAACIGAMSRRRR
jgi:hypothetical protein